MEGKKWREIYDKLKENPNPYSGLPEPRTPFEARMKEGGFKEGYSPIWGPSTQVSAEDETLPPPVGYSQTVGGFARVFDIEGNLVGTSDTTPVESDDISPVDFIPWTAIGSLVASGGKLIGAKLLATVAKYGAEEVGIEASEVLATSVAKKGGLGASDLFSKFASRLLRDESGEIGKLRLPGTKVTPELLVGEQRLEEIAASKVPVVIRDMSVQTMEALKQAYGSGLADGLQEKGTIMSYEAASKAVEGLGGAFQAHHVAEVKVLKLLGQDTAISPSVILTAGEHAEISSRLDKFIPKGEVEHMTKAELLNGYKKAYQGHPQWLAEVKRYLSGAK